MRWTVWATGLASLVKDQITIRNLIDGQTVSSNKNAVRTVCFALTGEIHELANELGWKYWRKSEAPDVARILDEFADVTAYYGTLASIVMDRCNVGPEELAAAYTKKTRINLERLAGNVNGFVPTIPANETQEPIEPTWAELHGLANVR